MKKFYLTILTLLLWPVALYGADKALSLSGSGTEADPWLIQTAADLVEIADACNKPTSGTTITATNVSHYDGKYFKITADLDLADSSFSGIAVAADGYACNVNCYFGGNIDGDGHRISNMRLDGARFDANTGKVLSSNKDGSRKWVGFVGNLGKSAMTTAASVRNLTFDSSCYISSYGDCGTVAGKMFKKATVENVVSYATIESYNSAAGGIAGSSASATADPSTIRSCAFYGTLKEISKCGGIIGDLGSNGIVADCLMAGKVQGGNWSDKQASQSTSAGQNIGGIAGSNSGSITGCAVTGQVKVGQWIEYTGTSTIKWGQNVGGISGSNSGLIENCATGVPVIGHTGFVGAICGYNSGKKTETVNKGVNSCVCWGYAAGDDPKTTGAVAGRGASSATSSQTGTFENVFYDISLRGAAAVGGAPYAGVTGMSTSELTSGNAIEGLDPEYWSFRAGMYPTLKKLATEPQKIPASVYLLLPEGQTVDDFHGTAAVSTAITGITMSLSETEWFSLGSDATSVTTLDPRGERRTALATLAAGDFKQMYLLAQKPVLFAGAGTQADPFLISNPADLVTLAKVTSDEEAPEHYPNTYFRITADLDMTGTDFGGIASAIYTTKYRPIEKYYFSGHIDGDGHTVSNITIHGVSLDADGKPLSYADKTAPSRNAVGFIGNLGNGASVRNLHIRNAKMDASQYVGGIVGLADQYATISNCSFDGRLTAYNEWAGGILGCSISKPVSDQDVLLIENCRVSGKILGERTVGGIVADGYAVVNGCVNLADVTAGATYAASDNTHDTAGGIIGSMSGEVTNCLNLATVTAEDVAGGIAGEVSSAWRGNITTSVNAGIVVDSSTTGSSKIGAVAGYTPRIGDAKFTGNYFDTQYSPLSPFPGQSSDGMTATATADLTTEELPEALRNDCWTARKGFYPVPSAFADDETVKAASATYVLFGTGQNIDNMIFPATINTAMPLTASISGSDVFSIVDGSVVSSAVTETTSATLTLACGDVYTRSMVLKKIPFPIPGSGTAEDPFLISTVAEWNALSASMADNKYNYMGTVTRLGADIDFTDQEFHQIGSSQLPFEGKFDGAGHTVKGVKIQTGEEASSHAGLFALLGQHSDVSDMTIASSYFASHGRSGALAGEAGGKISKINVATDVTVIATEFKTDLPPISFNRAPYRGYYAGGVVGFATPQADISGCVNNAGVIDEERNLTYGIRGNRYAGGIVGGTDINAATPRLTDCVNRGYIAAMADRQENVNPSTGEVSYDYVNVYAGGVAGMFSGTIRGCSNYGGAFAVKNPCAGGIVGHSGTSSLVEDCHNYGIVYTAWMYAGGIVGVTGSKTSEDVGIAVVRGCHNEGSVETAVSAAGGIVGQVGWASEIHDCYNLADITIPMSMAGGIAAQALVAGEIDDCYNLGHIKASSRAAGILAMTGAISGSSDVAFVARCFNAGNITSTQDIGTGYASGIATQATVVSDSYNVGTVTGVSGVGGISGSGDDMMIRRSFSLGNIVQLKDAVTETITDRAGHIVGTPLRDTGKVASSFPDYRAGIDKAYYPDAFIALPQDDATGVTRTSYATLMSDKSLLARQDGTSAFIYATNCLPRLSGMEDLDAAKAYAACYTLAENDTPDHVTAPVALAELEGVKWTSTGLLSISGSEAVPTKTEQPGEATLTATCGDYSVTYTLTVAPEDSGVDSINPDMDCPDAEYYTVTGLRVTRPASGQILIRRQGDSVRKVIVR